MNNLCELKPCPFCGSVPTIEPWHNAKHGYMVSCSNIEGPNLCEVHPGVAGTSRSEAIRMWNRRAPAPADLRERVEALPWRCEKCGNGPFTGIVLETARKEGWHFTTFEGAAKECAGKLVPYDRRVPAPSREELRERIARAACNETPKDWRESSEDWHEHWLAAADRILSLIDSKSIMKRR